MGAERNSRILSMILKEYLQVLVRMSLEEEYAANIDMFLDKQMETQKHKNKEIL